MNTKKMIGVIGGMGPYASAYFYKLLITKSTKEYGAKNNDDYPEVVIDSVPVPDFISDTKHLSVAKKILMSRVMALNNFGCNVIAMACNTGHLLYTDLAKNSQAPFISLIKLACLRAKDTGMKRVGLLATETTIRTQLYHKILKGEDVETITPDKVFLKKMENMIRFVIANGETTRFETTLTDMTNGFIKNNNLDGVILGCTELPLVLPNGKLNNIIDSLDVLADYLLKNFYTNK
jgi:aspartate racemase